MKYYLNWAIANLPAVADLEPERARELVHDAYHSAGGEVFVIGLFLCLPCFWIGRKLLDQWLDPSSSLPILAVLLTFASAKPIDWYIKRRIASRARE
jgi:hypothetical protein